jgi:hypothetical protein
VNRNDGEEEKEKNIKGDDMALEADCAPKTRLRLQKAHVAECDEQSASTNSFACMQKISGFRIPLFPIETRHTARRHRNDHWSQLLDALLLITV